MDFKYELSEILMLLSEAFKDGMIDQTEKVKIKGKWLFNLELLFSANPNVNILCQKYDKSKDRDGLIQGLKKIVNSEKNETFSEEDSEPEEFDKQKIANDVTSSPFDDRMGKIKRDRLKKKMKEIKQQPNQIAFFGSSVMACEEGLSPKVVFKKNKYGDSDSD
jgi:hypothetical protein